MSFTLPPDLMGFLMLLAITPGVMFSQLDNISWFKALSPGIKLAFQVIVSGGSAAVLTLVASGTISPDVLKVANSFYMLALPILVAILANFITHAVVNVIAKPAGKALKAYAVTHGPQG